MRWWERGERSLEEEEAWFRAAGLLFEIDRAALERDGVVVFKGELRLDGKRCPAQVVYPDGYLSGHHPVVIAPELPIDRHKGPDGSLCLDHPVMGATDAMTGAEAAERAERLWRLSVQEPEGLRDEEADAPDPRVDWYAYEAGSAVVMADVDVSGHSGGYLRLGLTQLTPLRGALLALGVGKESYAELSLGNANRALAGSFGLSGLWTRVDERPRGPELADFVEWVHAEHATLFGKAIEIARVETARRRQRVPALAGFVFPDEIARDVFADTWILFVCDPDGTQRIARAYSINAPERWIRQPQLEPLGERGVAVAGLGALGSPVTAHLARAGVGDWYLVDSDVVRPGNRVRHDCDLGDLGFAKVVAVSRRVMRINPYASIQGAPIRFGAAFAGDLARHQSDLDAITSELQRRDLIVNASAHIATGIHIATIADAARVPVVHVMVSSGAWGARVLLQRHGVSGCLECLGWHQESPAADSPEIPVWSEDPDLPEVMDEGCAQATFTGPGFEIAEAASVAARVAVQALLDGDGYPRPDFDMVTLHFRDRESARPTAVYSGLPRHPSCTACTDA